MLQHFELRLQEMSVPSGEIALADLAAISGKLQDLSTRVSRWVAEIHGAGRSPNLIADVAALRLTAAHAGSTVLEISAGRHGTLDVALPYERQVSERFWSIFVAIGSDTPPSDAPSNVRETVVQLIDALERAAPLVEVTWEGGATIEFRPADRNRYVWAFEDAATAREVATVVGMLEAVDLKTSRFRIADDVGHRIALERVADPQRAAQLIGQRVSAHGGARHDRRGRLVSIDGPVLTGVALPDEYFQHLDRSSWAPSSDDIGPDPNGAIDIDDDEWAAFLDAIESQ